MRLLIGLFILCTTICLSCKENDVEEVDKVVEDQKFNTEEADTVQILYSDSAKVKVQIDAPKLVSVASKKDPTQEFPDGVSVVFFNSKGGIKSKLTSKYAIREIAKNIIIVRDSVVLTNDEQQKLETEEMTWDEQKNKIYSDKFVRVTTPQQMIEGYGFTSDAEFSKWTMDTISGIIKTESLNLE